MRRTLWLVCAVLLPRAAARAQAPAPKAADPIGFEQELNGQVPLDLRFRDETGASVPLSRFLGRKPAILALVYYRCPTLCTETLNGLLRALRALPLDAGDRFNVVTVSFDPRETSALAAAKKKAYWDRYGRASAASSGWTFLTGDAGSIRRLTRAAGFRYFYDAASGQYAHATGLLVLTPRGKISRYLFGVEFSPEELRRALVAASGGTIGSPAERLLFFCRRYDPAAGPRGASVLRAVRAAGALTVLALAGVIGVLLRRERAAGA